MLPILSVLGYWAIFLGHLGSLGRDPGHPEFQQVDAEDRAGKTAYEEAWEMGQMEARPESSEIADYALICACAYVYIYIYIHTYTYK